MNLVKHARREMELIGEDKNIMKGVLKICQDFSNMNHSGATAEYTIQILENVLRGRNLSNLTDDPDEWILVGTSKENEDEVWQNTRRGEAFSNDGGKTYYLLSEGGNDLNREPLHNSTCTHSPTISSEEKVEVDGS